MSTVRRGGGVIVLIQKIATAIAALALSDAALAETADEGFTVRASPTEAVDAAPLDAASEDAAPMGPARDPLYELIAAGGDLSVEEADALLHEAYDAYPTPTTRSRAFALAAEAASAAGRHELALAWIDWAIGEAESAPDRDPLLAERLEQATRAALAAGNPVLARDYARRAGAHATGWSDLPDRRSVRFEELQLECPDVIDGAFVRLSARAERVGEGLLSISVARCDYAPIAGDAAGGFAVSALRSHMDAEERTREVVETGLGRSEVEGRGVITQRLSMLITVIEPLFLDDGEGFLGYAQQSRLGVNDVAAFAYATAMRDGVFYAGSASASVWDWPPTELGARAEAGLRGVIAAR